MVHKFLEFSPDSVTDLQSMLALNFVAVLQLSADFFLIWFKL